MKKFNVTGLATLLLAAVVLSGCSGVSEGDDSQSESVQNSNVSENASSETESTSTSEEEWTNLSQAEVDWFNNSFFNVSDNIITNAFLNCEYSDVKDIDLEELFYDCPRDGQDRTDEENAALKQEMGEIETDVQKVPTSYMDEMLQKYANIKLADTNKVDLESFVYLAEYDAYYLQHGDTHYSAVTVESGVKDSNGTVKLQCLYAETEETYEVTLIAHEDGYYFVSNIKK